MKMSATGMLLIALVFISLSFKGSSPENRMSAAGFSFAKPDNTKSNFISNIYANITASGAQLSQQVFEMALVGFDKLHAQGRLNQDSILTIIDFSKSSRVKRLHVVDLKSGKLVFNSIVAHGRNTGDEFAKSFSNQPNSHKSSLGFYVTGSTYNGSNGYSLVLDGVEKGFNDKAKERAIVMHGAAYANENVLQSGNRLGRSYGCPALPEHLNKKVIEKIKGGNCLFIFYPDQQYLINSKLING